MTLYDAPIPYNAPIPYDGEPAPPPPPSLTVTSILPASGPYLGGQAVTLHGTRFVVGMSVTIGGQAATLVTVVSEATLTARTPARLGAAGSVDVTVSDPLGDSATLAGGYSYDAAIIPPPPPAVPTTLRRLPYVAGSVRARVPYVTKVMP